MAIAGGISDGRCAFSNPPSEPGGHQAEAGVEWGTMGLDKVARDGVGSDCFEGVDYRHDLRWIEVVGRERWANAGNTDRLGDATVQGRRGVSSLWLSCKRQQRASWEADKPMLFMRRHYRLRGA